MELRRVAGSGATWVALGRADLNTTLGVYGRQDTSDLERATESYTDWPAAQDEATFLLRAGSAF
jgi:hypothetical protein